MKKSKLIVPAALAVMLLSTAASVTGTVAWFTANRAVDIDASEFAVTTTDGNLSVVLEAGANSVINANGKTVEVAKWTDTSVNPSVEKAYALTDASVDIQNLGSSNAETAVVYTNDGDTFTEYTPDAYVAVAPGSNTEKYPSGLDHVVLCVSWKMTFKYEFSENSLNNINLFFDIEKSAFSQVDTANNLETGNGFRIGMASQQSCLVWANLEQYRNCNYVTNNGTSIDEKDPVIFGDDPATDATETRNAPGYYTAADEALNANNKKGKFNGTNANYAAYTLISATSRDGSSSLVNLADSTKTAYTAADGAFPRATDTTTNQTQRGDYIGTFDPANRDANNICSLVVYCYAWFEGSDPYVVNASVMNTMAASMHFYTRKNYTGA